jgi:hypothetical protein
VGFITIEGDTTFNQPQDIIGLAQLAMGACYVLMVRGSNCLLPFTRHLLLFRLDFIFDTQLLMTSSSLV